MLQEIGSQEYEGVAEYQKKQVHGWVLEADVGVCVQYDSDKMNRFSESRFNFETVE